MATPEPNMGLILPTIGQDSGLFWEQNTNANMTTIGGHTHAAGSGVQIQPSGLNINAALSFQNQQATNVQAVLFTDQSSLATLNALYTVAGDLWYNDPTGAIQITVGGAVNATSSGISSGSASAAFVSSVLVVNAASNTPANIKAGSVLIGNNVAASKFLTLAPPAAMAANFTLTLPSQPASTLFVTLDSSGNFATTSGISPTQIAAGGIQAAQIASGSLTTTQLSASAGILGSQLSASAGIVSGQIASNTIQPNKLANVTSYYNGTFGTYSNATGSYTTIVSQVLTGSVANRPVFFYFYGYGVRMQDTGSGMAVTFRIYDLTNTTSLYAWTVNIDSSPGFLELPATCFNAAIVDSAGGNINYALQAAVTGGTGTISTGVTGTAMLVFQV